MPWTRSAWCYVDESCPAGKKGSFGRRHEVCTPEPPPPPKDEYNYTAYLRNKNNEEYKGQWKVRVRVRVRVRVTMGGARPGKG